ncbi:MAG: sortase [Actinomycetota bacterium]|jgi:sortase A
MMRMGGTKRLLVVFLAGILFSVGGAAVLKKKETPDNPQLTSLALPTTTTTPTTVPPTTAPPVSRPSKPVAAPRNAYAAEPVVQLGTIEIPKIGLFHQVMHGISMRNIDHGPSHWPGTAMPGEVGNTVFAGHRVTHSHPFLRINELEIGDPVVFHVGGVRSTYTVTGSEVVYPNQLSIVDQTSTPTGTLFACHPPHSAKQRYVVHLALLETVPE